MRLEFDSMNLHHFAEFNKAEAKIKSLVKQHQAGKMAPGEFLTKMEALELEVHMATRWIVLYLVHGNKRLRDAE
jgi:hypothetical protein